MIIDKSLQIDKEYMSSFEKKFRKFIERLPIYIDFSFMNDMLVIQNLLHEDTFYKFKVDITLSIGDFIHSIENYFKEHVYPRLFNLKENIEYIIIKVNLKKNEVVLEQVSSGSKFVYQLTLPLVLFLRGDIIKDPRIAYNYFSINSKYMYQVSKDE